MKKILSFVILPLILFISCTEPESIPLTRKTVSEVVICVNGGDSFALGTDGKLYMSGSLLESSGDLKKQNDSTPLSEKQFLELPQEIKQALTDSNHNITGIYNWHLVADEVVDFWVPGPVYYLTGDGKLYAIHDDLYTTPGVPVLVSENVSKLCRTYPVSFIQDNGDLIMQTDWEQFLEIKGAEPFEGVSGHKLVKLAENARDASTGGPYNFAYVDAYGQLWVCGYNDFGTLANGKYDEVRTLDYILKKNQGSPMQPNGYDHTKFHKVMDDVKQVFASVKNIFAIKNDGSLWSWGANEYGQAGVGTHGDGDPNTRDIIVKPKKILENISKISYISAEVDLSVGRNAFLALTENGNLYSWGDNHEGNFANGEFGKKQKDIFDDGLYADIPTLVLSGVKDFECAYDYGYVFMALKENGDLYTWGNSVTGGVGNGIKIFPDDIQTTFANVRKQEYMVLTPTKIMEDVVFINSYYGIGAVKSDGTVWNWGNNPFGWEIQSNYDIQNPNSLQYLSIFASPTKNPYISATIGADGTVSFVPTPVE